MKGFAGGSVVKNLPANAGNASLISGPDFPGDSEGKESTCNAGWRPGFDLWVGKIPWRRAWQPTPVFFAWRIPTDRGAWWATVHGVTKSRTRLSDKAHTPGRSHMPQNNQTCVPQLLRLCSRAWDPKLLKTSHPRACFLQQEKPLQ